MDAVLQLILLVVFSVCIIALAALMTWVVVKVSPTPDPSRQRDSSG